jgi:peroxiredoxin
MWSLNNILDFDMLELTPELELTYRKFGTLTPLKAGDSLHHFNLQKDYTRYQQFFNGAETHGPLSLTQLLNKPLVISFYSSHWGEHGLKVLKELNNIQHEIRAHGGNLLVVNTEDREHLAKVIWDNSLTLNFYKDSAHQLARLFKVYAHNAPTWNTYPGIDVNIPLLATFVVSASKVIVYDHVDRTLSGQLAVKEILAAVYQSADQHGKRSA